MSATRRPQKRPGRIPAFFYVTALLLAGTLEHTLGALVGFVSSLLLLLSNLSDDCFVHFIISTSKIKFNNNYYILNKVFDIKIQKQ